MKKHIENIQGQLLIEIYKRYSSRSGTSLNAFIKNTLKENDGDLEMTKNLKKDIEELEQRGLVTWVADGMGQNRSDYPESPKFKSQLGSDINNTFKDIYVEVKLTPDKGLDHAANYVSSQANLSNNYWIRILTVGLLIITAAGVIVQMRQCSISKSQQTQQPTKCDTISRYGHAIPLDEHKTTTLYDSTKKKLEDTAALRHNPIYKTTKPK